MDSHNFQWRYARVTHHAEDTVILFGNRCQSMLYRRIVFVRFAPVGFCDRSLQPLRFDISFPHSEPGVIAQFVFHNFNSVSERVAPRRASLWG